MTTDPTCGGGGRFHYKQQCCGNGDCGCRATCPGCDNCKPPACKPAEEATTCPDCTSKGSPCFMHCRQTVPAETPEALLPCPFCRCVASVYLNRGEYRVECEGSCHAMTCWWHSKAEAIANWNRRAGCSNCATLRSENERLREAIR